MSWMQFSRYAPGELIRIPAGVFEGMGSDLERIFTSARWYRFFKFWLGFPAKNNASKGATAALQVFLDFSAKTKYLCVPRGSASRANPQPF
jgi:hypothetical protein